MINETELFFLPVFELFVSFPVRGNSYLLPVYFSYLIVVPLFFFLYFLRENVRGRDIGGRRGNLKQVPHSAWGSVPQPWIMT